MQRRTALSLIGGATGATLSGCGGGGPSAPSSVVRPGAGAIPVAAHYANWWTIPGQWAQAATRPRRGIYSSDDTAVIAEHNALMQSAGIWPLVSWWGPDAYAGDKFLNLYLPIAGPQLGLLYEAVGPGRLAADPWQPVDFNDAAVVAQFVGEMEYLRDKYFNGPSGSRFVRVDGRPLIFIWITNAFRGPFDAVAAGVREFVYLVGSEFHIPAYIPKGHERIIRGLDAITSYGFYDTDRFPTEMNDEFLASYATALRKWREVLNTESQGVQLIPPMTFAYDERNIPDRAGYWFTSSEAVARRYADIVRGFVGAPGFLELAYCTSATEYVEGSPILPTDDPDRPDYLGIVRNVFMSGS